jgi:hypothetical protein
MAQRQRRVFVLDVADGPAFAFEADNAVAADALVRTPWFARAFSDFRARGHKTCNSNGPLRARAATEAETSLYWDCAAEFAEETEQLLLARIGEP